MKGLNYLRHSTLRPQLQHISKKKKKQMLFIKIQNKDAPNKKAKAMGMSKKKKIGASNQTYLFHYTHILQTGL